MGARDGEGAAVSGAGKKWAVWLAVAAAVAGLIFLAFSDERPPDVSDLMPKRVAVPDEQNALPLLVQAGGLVVTPEDLAEALNSIPQGDAFYLRKILADNAAALALFDEALRRPELQFEEFNSPTQPRSHLSAVRDLAKLRAAWAWLLFLDGDQAHGLDEAVAVVEFGHRVLAGDGVLIDWLVGVTVEWMGLARLAEMVPEASLPSREMLPIAARLAQFEGHGAALTETTRAEHQFSFSAIDTLPADVAKFAAITGAPIPAPMELLGGLAFQPNRTKRMYAEFSRETISAAPHPHAEFHSRAPGIEAHQARDPRLMVLSPNATGNLVLRLTLPMHKTMHDKKSATEARFAMTRALIALRCHWLDHGALPERLDGLVPEYLPAVPLDDFDGQPLRYSREKRLLWSIGSDLIDSGGATDPDDSKQQKTEPTIRLDWAQ